MVEDRGQDCGDIEITGYLVNVTGPVSLVLDLLLELTITIGLLT